MRSFCLIVIALLFTGILRAQTFNYTVSTDSVAWQELNAQTILNANNSAWNFTYKISLGFTFNYLGRNFDSLRIEGCTYLVFDEDRNYAFAALSGYCDKTDSAGIHSVLGYSLSGTNGNHILKVQFKNVGKSSCIKEAVSCQVWICESGNRIEFHMGPGASAETDPYQHFAVFFSSLDQAIGPGHHVPIDSLHLDTLQCFHIGLLNMNMDTDTRGFLLAGNPASPQGQVVNLQSANLPCLLRMPRQGIKYTFQPSSN